MSQVTDAFDALRALARTGGPFRHGQVYVDRADETPDCREDLVGRGFDIRRTVQVPDQDTDTTVDGTLLVRVIDAVGSGSMSDQPVLIIGVDLAWMTSAGHGHKSHAHYAIPVKNAPILEGQVKPDTSALDAITPGTPPDEANAALAKVQGRQAEINDLYGARWEETFPGSIGEMMRESDNGSGEAEVMISQAFLDDYQLVAQYHFAAVAAAKEPNFDAACLLSGTELGGAASPDEIVKVYDWVRRQPEVTSAV